MSRTSPTRRWLAAAAAVALAAAWWATRPPTPHGSGSDVYTHLCVARHLVQGDGFVNDVVYPLSLTFPFAAQVPQPLVHRPPGYPLVMTLPVALAGADTVRAERLAGHLSLLLLALIAWRGAAHALGRGRGDTVAPWLAVLLVNPLLHMTVGWSQVEIPVALLLLWLWTRVRARAGETDGSPSPGSAVVDGLLAAAIALLRADLFWLPWLWLLWAGRLRGRPLLVAAACWAGVLAPWWIRTATVTGHPFFTLQAYAEHLKQTPAWPGYSIYASLSPESFWHTLRHDPDLILHKTLAGLRYYLTRLDGWLPLLLWAGGGLAAAARFARGRRPGDPLPVLLVSLAALTLAYAPLSHTLRYMAVLLPVLSLELWLAVAEALAARLGGLGGPRLRHGLLLAGAATCIWILPARMPGWERARDAAAVSAATLPAALERLARIPPGPVFTDSAALLWHGKRAGVWSAGDPEVEKAIRSTIVDMERAPAIRQGPSAGGSGDD